VMRALQLLHVHEKPLNVMTLSQTKSDNLNQMITETTYFYLISFSKWEL